VSVNPPRWTEEQLAADRETAIEAFRAERMQEPLEQYLEAFDDFRGTVEELLETSLDLTTIEEIALEIVSNERLLHALRYAAGPPISMDDLRILSEASSLTPTRVREDPEIAKRVVETVLLGLDRRRFPWVGEQREPDEAERAAAALASAVLWAQQRVRTARATEGKEAQEQAVEDRLIAAGFEKVPAPREVPTLAAAPANGTFCRETTFGSRKADILVGLWDDRKMPIECKVSNSAINSIKRVENDAAVKAVIWRREFGELSVVPAAVLSGVYNMSSLHTAQRSELTVFWAHDLDALTDWIETTKP
jgi:hypothetical protein